MRMLVLPATLILSFLLYLLFPAVANLSLLLRRLYAALLSRTQNDERRALGLLVLVCALGAFLLGAIHPLVCLLTLLPLFPAFALVPECVSIKRELDSGVYMKQHDAYDELVRSSCAQLAPVFVCDAVVPVILIGVGMPLYLGGALGFAYLALRAVCEENALARRIVALLLRPADKLFTALLTLCSCVVGRSPFRTTGSGAQERLMSVLGIAMDDTDTHAPMSGDIAQGVFLCCFCTALLCLLVVLVFFGLC